MKRLALSLVVMLFACAFADTPQTKVHPGGTIEPPTTTRNIDAQKRSSASLNGGLSVSTDVKKKSSSEKKDVAKEENKKDSQKEDKDNTFKWYDNLDEAMKESERLHRPIFALFTGSDWCPWCVKLEKEILSKPEFQNYAAKHFIMFKVDELRKKKMPQEVAAKNREYLNKYGIRGFPTVLILDKKGRYLTQTGYRAGGPEKYIEHLKYIQGNN